MSTLKTSNLQNEASATVNVALDTSGGVTLGAALPVGSGGTGVTTLTGIVKGNGTSAFTAASAGTDYVSPSANGLWNLLATLTASSSSSLTDTTNLTSTYANYALVLTNILPVTTSTTLQLQARVNAAYQTSGYVGAVTGNANGTTQGWTMSSNIQLSRATDVSNTNGGVSGIVYISNPSSGSTVKVWNWQIGYYASGGFFATAEGSAGYTAATTAITGFQLLFSSGNIASGTVKIYGWN